MSDEVVRIETRIVDARVGRDFPLPQYATDGAAGMDLYACLDAPCRIMPGEVKSMGTGVAVCIHRPQYMALLVPRSGLGVKHGIVLANTVGVIDSDYQDEIRVALFNRGRTEYEVAPGERVCQLIVVPVVRAALQVVAQFSRPTGRGTGGFGSTGRF